jgi:hypothetical protein
MLVMTVSQASASQANASLLGNWEIIAVMPQFVKRVSAVRTTNVSTMFLVWRVSLALLQRAAKMTLSVLMSLMANINAKRQLAAVWNQQRPSWKKLMINTWTQQEPHGKRSRVRIRSSQMILLPYKQSQQLDL